MNDRQDKEIGLWTALGYLERLEGKLAELYEWFSDLYKADQQAAHMFRNMGYEERSHQNIVQFQIRLVSKERLEFDNTVIDLYGVKKALSMIEQIRNQEPAPTLQEAIEYSLELENYSCERCYLDAIVHANPSIANLINNISTSDRKHMEWLRRFGQKRGWIAAAGAAN